MAVPVTGLATGVLAPGDDGTTERPGDRAVLSSADPEAPDGEVQGATWAEVLEGSLGPDWEEVDGELRRFLARLGGVPDRPTVRDPWPVGRLWIAAAAAMALARRAQPGAWRVLRRRALAAARAPVRGPMPIGPWPLGPP
jgi:hypothetical protein